MSTYIKYIIVYSIMFLLLWSLMKCDIGDEGNEGDRKTASFFMMQPITDSRVLQANGKSRKYFMHETTFTTKRSGNSNPFRSETTGMEKFTDSGFLRNTPTLLLILISVLSVPGAIYRLFRFRFSDRRPYLQISGQFTEKFSPISKKNKSRSKKYGIHVSRLSPGDYEYISQKK